MKSPRTALFAALVFVFAKAQAEPLYSPSWGFRFDLPEGYEFVDGDGKNRFSFRSGFGTSCDIVVYTGKPSVEALAEEVEQKLSGRGERNGYEYNGKKAVLSRLTFPDPQKRGSRLSGWALYVELKTPENRAGTAPILFVFAYGPQDDSFQSLHLSILDSIAATEEDRRLPGPVTDFSYPAGNWERRPLAAVGKEAWFRAGDAEAAQALVDREFAVLRRYVDSPLWQEAWKRFYRAIYRDSFDRLKDAAFILERTWAAGDAAGKRSDEARVLAQKALDWVQGFSYERNLMGSDFVNLVSAVQDGRGDCDSRAMLWAIILEQAAIPAAIMVSREFGHAMGLADLEGEGARFPFREGSREYRWLVAETTARVGIGRIGENVSEITKWLSITF
ncbi:MAG: hypothetical protein LBH35_01910 [Treponema sp.]|nr:hypothetical protein [Treponema sp.]